MKSFKTSEPGLGLNCLPYSKDFWHFTRYLNQFNTIIIVQMAHYIRVITRACLTDSLELHATN